MKTQFPKEILVRSSSGCDRDCEDECECSATSVRSFINEKELAESLQRGTITEIATYRLVRVRKATAERKVIWK